jgi:hypothetical protein
MPSHEREVEVGGSARIYSVLSALAALAGDHECRPGLAGVKARGRTVGLDSSCARAAPRQYRRRGRPERGTSACRARPH